MLESNSVINAPENPDLRWRWLLEIIEDLRQRRPDLSTELIDDVYDRLVDLFLGRSNYGNTRPAVFGLMRRQLGWRINDSLRKRFDPDGNFTDHPAAALSLDLALQPVEGGSAGSVGDTIPASAASEPEAIVDRREAVRDIVESAERSGTNTLRAIIGEMVGLTPKEIAETYGVEVATVYKWKSRFVTLHRVEPAAPAIPRERSCRNRDS